MTGQAVAVHDIADAVTFVEVQVRKKLRRLMNDDEKQEMIQEGVVILFELAAKYDPNRDRPSRKPGHTCKTVKCCVPSFAGYAAMILPRRLLDAWHAHHPEHLLRTQDDGKRRYVYLVTPFSIDGMNAQYANNGTTDGSSVNASNDRSIVDVGNVVGVTKFMPVPEAA